MTVWFRMRGRGESNRNMHMTTLALLLALAKLIQSTFNHLSKFIGHVETSFNSTAWALI